MTSEMSRLAAFGSRLWGWRGSIGRGVTVVTLIAAAWQLSLYVEATFIPYHQMRDGAYGDLLATASLLSAYSEANDTIAFLPDQPPNVGWEGNHLMFQKFLAASHGSAATFADPRVVKAASAFERTIWCRTKKAKPGDITRDPANVILVSDAMKNLRSCIKWSVLSRFDPEKRTTSGECHDDDVNTKCQ